MELIIVTGLSGAGKSNALNCLEDMGYYCIDNMPPALIGIGMVHQHFMLIPQLNVTQNIYLGMKEAGFVFKKDKLMANVKALNDKYGFNVDPSALIWQLPVGVQQKVEILKVLIRKSRFAPQIKVVFTSSRNDRLHLHPAIRFLHQRHQHIPLHQHIFTDNKHHLSRVWRQR